MEDLLSFLKSQRLLVLASHDGPDIWVANVYFGIDDNFKIYFVSSEDRKHSQQILKNPNIAFSIAWFDEKNHENRKAVQGLGVCRPAASDEEVSAGVRLHNKNFPEFRERITVNWINSNESRSRVWVVEPRYVKHWDDERYGEENTKEFRFDKK